MKDESKLASKVTIYLTQKGLIENLHKVWKYPEYANLSYSKFLVELIIKGIYNNMNPNFQPAINDKTDKIIEKIDNVREIAIDNSVSLNIIEKLLSINYHLLRELMRFEGDDSERSIITLYKLPDELEKFKNYLLNPDEEED
jgi:hypothetical protein